MPHAHKQSICGGHVTRRQVTLGGFGSLGGSALAGGLLSACGAPPAEIGRASCRERV